MNSDGPFRLGIRHEMRGLAIEDSGEAILPANKLVSILRESTDGELTIDADENRNRGYSEPQPEENGSMIVKL